MAATRMSQLTLRKIQEIHRGGQGRNDQIQPKLVAEQSVFILAEGEDQERDGKVEDKACAGRRPAGEPG